MSSSRLQAYSPPATDSDDISGSRPAIAGGRPHLPPAEEGATLSPAQRREIYIKLERHVEQRHRIVSLLECEDDTTLSSNAGVTYASGSSRSVSVRDELAYHDDLVGPATAECLLESLAQYDDFSTNFSSIDILSKISAWLENPRVGDDGALRVMVNVLTILSRHDATRSIYVDAIHELVTMLGHTNTAIHARSAKMISRLAMDAVDETIMAIVTHVNNPSEDISELSTSILFAFRQHDATHNRLSRADIILKLVSFMDSDLIHVRCCLMATFALLANKENIRTTILRHKLLPIMCDILYKDKASSRMLSRLLWSFGQFMQYDDLRSAILQTDAIYALARLRSSKRLPQDSNTFLSDLIVNENLSLSFTSDSDDSSLSPFTSFQCLVGAQEAMEKVLSEEAALEKLLDYHQIKPQDYFVQAGFDEDLLNSGGVHLEEIYIYLIKEVEIQASGMLDDLAKLFHPFPCVLLTPKNSYRTPTLPDLPLGFDSVILERGNWHYQILKLTKHKEGRGLSEPMIDGESIPEGGGGGHLHHDSLARERGNDRDNGSKNPPPNQGPPGSGGGDDGGAGEDTNDDSEPSDMELDSSVERNNQMGTPKVVCDSHVEVNFPKPAVSSNSSKRGSPPSVDTLFQQFGMHAVMAVDVQSPSGPDPASVSLRFEHLGFYTDPLALEHPYENSKIQVKVDSSDKRVYPWTWFPESTTAKARTLTETNEHEVTGGVSVAIGTKNGVSVTGNIGGRITHGQEATRNLSRITALHGDTFVKWSYYVDDTYQQQDGLRVEHDRLPSLEFWLRKASAERPFCVELSSYWVSRVTPKKGTKFLSAFKKRQALPLLRNFCHLTCITLPPYIPRSAISTLRLGAHMPCSTEECIAVKSVEKDFELGIEMEGQVMLLS